ncbi:MAG: methyltransferase domain-containing protein [Solirubrobacteraceae bacterium]|jgi:SAM-dependent methyltransferase
MRARTAAVSHWMIDALDLQPGHRVLELAAGEGETGLLAAELIAPGGGLICSDQSEAMLDLARARAKDLELENVEFRVINAESIDLPVACVDGVLCRWGYMLMIDPAAAFSETRRVLRSGGRLALAVWAERDANPWLAVPQAVLGEHGLVEPADPDGPGPFALADRERLRQLLEAAGFVEVEIEAIDFQWRAASFEEWWERRLELSPSGAAVRAADPKTDREVAAEVAKRLGAQRTGGEIVVPARTLVVAASA